MPMKVTFDLSDKDLRHFKQVMKEAREKARSRPESRLMKSASQLLEHVRRAELPAFIRERLMHLETRNSRTRSRSCC